MQKKTVRILLAACGLCLLLGLFFSSDWYKRHYGMGFSDRMNIRVNLNGEHLPPAEYTLMYVRNNNNSYRPANRTETGYSIDSDYGAYSLSVDLGGKKIGFGVENVNNWWRTNILLDITQREDGTMRVVEQLDIINDEHQSLTTREWNE